MSYVIGVVCVVFALGLLFALSLCKAAARGDRMAEANSRMIEEMRRHP